MKTIAIATCDGQPNLTPSDASITALLEKESVMVHAVPWTKPINWQDFAMVLIRSPWDYHLRYQEFLAWLSALEKNGVTVWNTPDTIRWNSDKSYLTSLPKIIPVVPTILVDNAQNIPESSPWEHIVVKPSVGASSHGIKHFTGSDTKTWRLYVTRLLQERAVLLQQYLPQIEQGEYSFMFFDKKFSHAVIKTPARGDFRVQPEFGGTVKAVFPALPMVQSVQKILDIFPDSLLYARVDGLLIDNVFTLMEIELCEPELFLDIDHGAPKRFVEAILRRLS